MNNFKLLFEGLRENPKVCWFLGVVILLVVGKVIVPSLVKARRSRAIRSFAVKCGFRYLESESNEELKTILGQRLESDFNRIRNKKEFSFLNRVPSNSVFDPLFLLGEIENILYREVDPELVMLYVDSITRYPRSRLHIQSKVFFQSINILFPPFSLCPRIFFDVTRERCESSEISFSSFPNFSKLYCVEGEDPKAVTSFFSPRIISFLEAHPRWYVLGEGSQCILHRKPALDFGLTLFGRRRVSQLGSFIAEAENVYRILAQK